MPTRRPLLVLALLAAADQGTAQGWLPLSPLSEFSATAYDSERDRLVCFDAEGKVWELNTVELLHRAASSPSPEPREGQAFAFDPVRRQAVMFGGISRSSGVDLSDTWTWDGCSWRAYSGPAPSPRRGAAMAFDVARARMVLFGGMTGTSTTVYQTDTWEFDGNQWTRQVASQTPVRGLMVFDPIRSACVMVSIQPTMHWEWSGSNWSLITPPGVSGPIGFFLASVAADPGRQRLVAATWPTTLWEWDGTTWSRMLAPLSTMGSLAMWYDDQAARIALAGTIRTAATADIAVGTWDGTTLAGASLWRTPTMRVEGTLLSGLAGPTIYGGYDSSSSSPSLLNDMWRFEGDRWRELAVPTMPLARGGAAVAHRLTESLMFGGGGFQPLADFWSWDGSAWHQLPSGPPPRYLGAMAADPTSQRVLLFGGQSGATTLDDTWLFDGHAWRSLGPGTRPSARSGAAMAFDHGRGTAVLFGGLGTNTLRLRDTWEWNGSNWTPRSPVVSPPIFRSSTLMYHWPTGRLRLAGTTPNTGGVIQNELWDFDGINWTLVAQQGSGFQNGAAAVIDYADMTVFMTDGLTVRRWSTLSSSVATYGSGCGAETPRLAPRRRPMAGAPDSGLELAASAGQLYLIAIDGVSAQIPLGNGCDLLLANPVAEFSGLLDTRGMVSLVMQVPRWMRGQTVYAQGAVLDPSQPGGFTVSPGLAITIGS